MQCECRLHIISSLRNRYSTQRRHIITSTTADVRSDASSQRDRCLRYKLIPVRGKTDCSEDSETQYTDSMYLQTNQGIYQVHQIGIILACIYKYVRANERPHRTEEYVK